MTQIPILKGIYADSAPDFRTAYPVNLVPVPKATGISEGYLRPGDGIVPLATGPGVDRGGIVFQGTHYRVMGDTFVSVSSDGVITQIGVIGNDDSPVSMDYGFDRLAIASAGKLFLWDGALAEVTDPDLGPVNDVLWVDGYFMTTDGVSLVVTELNDPTQVNPLKYGSAEADPDPVVAILKLRNEVVALNRHTIEIFDNTGGNLFPFSRIEGAQIEKGAIGRHCCCVFLEAIAFLGSGVNEEPSIYIGSNGQTSKIATHEIDTVLSGFTAEELSRCIMEARNDKAHWFLYLHLPDRTIVYDASGAQDVGEPVWFTLTSSQVGYEKYKARHFTRHGDKWIVSNGNQLGWLVNDVSSHFGQDVRCEFSTMVMYNNSTGALVHDLELIALTGSGGGTIRTSYSLDGVTWSNDREISTGAIGQRSKRLVWLQQGHFRNWRVQRFQFDSKSHLAVARLEARLEPLAF